MNNRFHLEAKLPWSYDYPLVNHIATNKSSAIYREMPLFSRLYPSFGYIRKFFPPRGLKYSLLISGRMPGYLFSPGIPGGFPSYSKTGSDSKGPAFRTKNEFHRCIAMLQQNVLFEFSCASWHWAYTWKWMYVCAVENKRRNFSRKTVVLCWFSRVLYRSQLPWLLITHITTFSGERTSLQIALLHLHANADLLFLLFLFFPPPFFFVPATGPLTRYLKTGCSQSNQTWQYGRSPWGLATEYFWWWSALINLIN